MRRGLTVIEVTVAAAIGCWLFLAMDTHLDQQAAMIRLLEAKLAARQAAATAARRLLSNPAAPPGAVAGFQICVEPLGPAGVPGISRLRVTASGPASDSVEVVVRD